MLGYANPAASSASQDYTIMSLLLFPVWAIIDGRRRGIKRAWLFCVLLLFTSSAFRLGLLPRNDRAPAPAQAGRVTGANRRPDPPRRHSSSRMIADDLRDRRLAVIREHMDTEVTKEFDRTLATFKDSGATRTTRSWRPVRSSTATTRSWGITGPPGRPSPTSVMTIPASTSADDAVIVEFDLLGTNLGEFYGLPPTGKAFRVPIIAVFFFDGDRIVNERIYFDSASLVTQIGRGELLALAGTGEL